MTGLSPSLRSDLRSAGSRLARRVTRRSKRAEPRPASPRLLEAFARSVADPFFVEIGSNDGLQHDHLRPFILSRGWRGIMVEPVGYIFNRLAANYGEVEGVALENVAVGPESGSLPFFHLMDASEADRAQLPSWYDGVGSFRKDVVLGHVKDIPDVAERIVVKDVPTVTFDELCERHSVAQVDLILIDTEGYDWEIIRHIDLRNWSPTLLVYEHFHLSREARSDSLEHLAGLGYEFLEEGFDTFCLGPRADRRLRRTWRRLRPAYPGVSAYDEER